MGYFGRIEKCARYYDSSAGQYKWGAWKYTGSSAAGVDYVSSEGLAVVYRVPVYYAASDSGLQPFAVWTNYVTPSSSGNPSTAYCYLYTADPTLGGRADIAVAPLGYEAFAGPVNFDASHVGTYLGFSFGALASKPAMLYFWFTSSVQYTVYGSNQIYHYATGNYDKLLNTGTRTPALTGGFPETGEGGGTGGGYSLIASGAYSNIGYEQNFEYSRRERSASYTALSFISGYKVQISAARRGEYDSGLRMDGYITRSTGFDSANGRPAGSITASGVGGGEYSLEFEAEAGVTYYLWTVIHQSGYIDTPVSLSVKPSGAMYSIKDCGTRLNIAQQPTSFSISVGPYQVGRIKFSCQYTAGVDVSVSYSGSDFVTFLYFSLEPDIDRYTGQPLQTDSSFYPGSTSSTTLCKNVTYYAFGICNGGLSPGTINFTIKPPTVLWTEGDRGEYLLMKSAAARSISLGEGKYSVLKLSFAYSGTARFYTSDSSLESYRMIEGFFSEQDDLDNHSGFSMNRIAEGCGSDKLGEPPDYDFACRVVAGRSYYLFTKSSAVGGPLSNALKTTVHIIPPPAPGAEYRIVESAESGDIKADCSFGTVLGYHSISRRRLSFAYRGAAGFSVLVTEPSRALPKLRLYLSDSEGADLKTGTPTGNILASYTAGESAAELTYSVDSRAEYYLFIVADEVYMEEESPLTLGISAPPPNYFRISQRAVFYGVAEPVRFEAAPGEGGVCLVELSFEKSGLVQFSSSDTLGNLTFLRGYLSYLPTLNALTGEPSAEIITAACGSLAAPGYSFYLRVEAGTSYYLFSRDDWLYSSAGFIINIKPVPGAMRIMRGGKGAAALPYVYRQGVWRAALPMCFSSGAWHTGG